MLEAATDPRRRARNLAGHEILSAPRRFVVVKNSVADEEAVGLPVNPRQLGRESLRATIGAGWPERRFFGLRRVGCVAENLRARRVIKTQRLRLIARNLEQPQGCHRHFLGSGFRDFKTQADMALSCEMIDLRGLHPGKNAAQRRAIGQIAVMEKELVTINGLIGAQMFDPGAEQVACSPNDTVNGVAFGEEQLGEVRAVLTGDTGDKCAFRFRHGRSMIQGPGFDKLEP